MSVTRASIDGKLDRLQARVHQAQDRTITWMPVAAIGAALAGMVAFWPRKRRRTRY
jgi:hypothetical protein